MSIISKRSTRAARSAAKTAPGPAKSSRPIAALKPANYELIECIIALQLRQESLDTLAEQAIGPLLAMFSARAGGLLIYHSQDSTLRLAASVGFSAAGRQQLANLRLGSADGWEIPLHGLLNRKAYIIERPHQHPFVPELLEGDDMRTAPNLASIPLYRGHLPVGVLLAIADRQSITDAEIMSHVLVYDVLALALDAGLRSRGEQPAPIVMPELPPLACEEWTDPLELVQRLEAELKTVGDERETLARRLGEVERRYAEALRGLEGRDAEHTRILASERDEATRRLAASERTSVEQRQRELAAFEEQLATVRASATAACARLESELAERNATFEASLGKLHAALRERETTLSARAGELAAVTEERDSARQSALQAAEAMRRLNAEVDRLRDEREGLAAAAARDLESHRSTAERELADTRARYDHMLAEAEAAGAAALARGGAADRRAAGLDEELRAARAEAEQLANERWQLVEAIGAPGTEPVAGVLGLRERIGTLAEQLQQLTHDREQEQRRAAEAIATLEQRAMAVERERDALIAAHALALDDLRADHRRALEEGRALSRRELEQVEATHRTQLAEARTEALRRLELERGEAQRRIETLRSETQERLDAARNAQGDALARAKIAETRAGALESEIADVRSEVARLSEERARVLAAVDDPGAEPATVIRALRDQVATLEGQLAVEGAERLALDRRLVAEAQGATARIAELQVAADARLAEARAAAQASLDDTRAAASATLEELRAALAERDGTLAERERVLIELGGERDRTRQAVMEATDTIRRQEQELAQARAELDGARTALTEARAHAESIAGRTATLDQELTRARAEVARLHDERARVVAAVDDPQAEPVAVIRALREQVEALSGELENVAAEREALEQGFTAEQASLHERLAALERERVTAERARIDAERAREEHGARAVALEGDLRRSEELLVAARRQLEDALRRSEVEHTRGAAGERPVVGTERRRDVTSGDSTAAARTEGFRRGGDAAAGSVAPTVEVLAPPPVPIVEVGGHRLLESDPTLRERLMVAVTNGIGADAPERLFIVNLLGALPGRVAELEAASKTSRVVAYASDGTRSRMLGAIGCFMGLPAPAEIVAAVDAPAWRPRRVLTVSTDVDSLIPAKKALNRSEHAVSMACDAKQAFEILGMMTPDVILVDLRTAAAADLLQTLELEQGTTRVLFILGEESGDDLRLVAEQLLRPWPLAVDDLVWSCAAALVGPPERPVPEPLRAGSRPRVIARRMRLARRGVRSGTDAHSK